MKIYVLLMLIGVIVGFSYIPSRQPKPAAPASPEPIQA
jgi:hypothetical protein